MTVSIPAALAVLLLVVFVVGFGPAIISITARRRMAVAQDKAEAIKLRLLELRLLEAEKRRESQLLRKREVDVSRIQIEETRPEQTLTPEIRGKGGNHQESRNNH